MQKAVVIMGVAGCGKSSLGQALAESQQWPLIEGDDFHSPANRKKMSEGIALNDADRADWLATLGAELQKHSAGVVLTCSALKRAYRDRLREAVPTLLFVFLEIDREEAQRRVVARSASHFFSASLVDNQFATLESPVGEAGVLALKATEPLPVLLAQLLQWLQSSTPNRRIA